ncbi:MAG: sigma-70 family RNA polymerase sigma factor [Acidimicrobiia bacterium]|nr:sigma-70 family RNA polymerase sigma factor [Acidimicrobiia bacterium]
METFEDFARDARSRLIGLAYALSGDRSLAEDIVQDALVATHRAWATIDVPLAYARRTVANLCASRIRRLGRERRALNRWMSSRPEVFAELDPVDAEFWKAVAALPARQRQVIALHYVDDLTVADIATALEIASGTVKSTLHDARRALAASLHLTDPSLDDPEEDA